MGCNGTAHFKKNYKHVTTINDNYSIINKWSFQFITDARVVINERNRFIIQATGGQSSNVVHFFNTELIGNLRQLKKGVFLHWCLIRAVPFDREEPAKFSFHDDSIRGSRKPLKDSLRKNQFAESDFPPIDSCSSRRPDRATSSALARPPMSKFLRSMLYNFFPSLLT